MAPGFGAGPPGAPPPGPGGNFSSVPQFLLPGMQVPPPLPDPSNWKLVPPPPIPKKYLPEIKEYVCTEMDAGAEMVRDKVSRWLLLQKLVDGSLRLSQWKGVIEALETSSEVISNEQWQSDFVVGAAPIVHSFVDRLYNDLFSIEKYYQVEAQPSMTSGSVEDPVYPTGEKFQALLLQSLYETEYQTRTYEILSDNATFGTAFAIPFYDQKTTWRWRQHPVTGQSVPIPEVQNRLVLESVPLHTVLPDVHARNSNTQMWQGVGRRIQIPFSGVLRRFKRGIYNLNLDEFKKQFKDGVEGLPRTYDIELWRDEALDAIATGRIKDRMVTAWEYHSEVPLQKGPSLELITVVITGRPEDKSDSGIMVRADHGPVLPVGGRPILANHFTPLPGVFGHGAVNTNLDLIYYLSSMINCLIDNARLSTNVQYKVRRGSSLANKIKNRKKGNVSRPGKMWFVDSKDDITPFEPLNFPSAAMENLVRYFEHALERRSSVSETTLAMSTREKTATEAYTLGQMGDIPLKTRLSLYVKNIFEPAGRIFVGMIQANNKGSATIPVMGLNGITQDKTITEEEIRTGKYRVIASFNKTDQLSLSKAQAMQQLTPTIFSPQMMQAYAIEGKHPSAVQWTKRIGNLLGIDGVDQLFAESPEAQTMQMLTQLPPEQIQQLLQMLQQQQLAEKQAAQAQAKGGAPGQPALPPGQANTQIAPTAKPNGNALGEPEGGASSLGHIIGMLSAASRERSQGGQGGMIQ